MLQFLLQSSNLENLREVKFIVFIPIFTLCFILSSILMFPLPLLPFCLEKFFYPFFKDELVGDTFPGSPSAENVLISPSFLKDIFTVWADSSFLSTFENFLPLTSGLHAF